MELQSQGTGRAPVVLAQAPGWRAQCAPIFTALGPRVSRAVTQAFREQLEGPQHTLNHSLLTQQWLRGAPRG